MASDSSDDSESDDQVQMRFHNELTSSSESSDEVSVNESVRGIFKFGKLTSSRKLTGKENKEFQVGKDKEEKDSEGDEAVEKQTLELNSDQSGEIVWHSSDTDSSAKVVGGFSERDSIDGTEHVKEQEIDSIDISDDSDMEADEKVDTAETVEEKETLRDNINSSHMSLSHIRGLGGDANIDFLQGTNDTDRTYQMGDSLSIKESFVILDPEPTSALSVVVNEQVGETEKSFQKAPQIPSLEGFEHSFEIIAESFGKSIPVCENMKATPPNSKDTKLTPHIISGNSTKEAFMDISQPSSAEVQKESLIMRPPSVKPSIIMQKQEPNETPIHSILIMEDETPKKTDEQCLKEVEQKPMVRQSFEVNDSAQESSQLEMEMVDIIKQEKEESAAEGNSLHMESFSMVLYEENITSKVDHIKQISYGCIQSDDEELTADAEQRPQRDSRIDDIEQLTRYEKQMGVSVQQPQMESFANEMESHVNETEQKPQEDTYADDAEERPLVDTQMDRAQGRLLKYTKIETAEESPLDGKDDAEQRSQKDSQDDYAEDEESSKKVSNLMMKLESYLVVSGEDRMGKNAEDGLQNIRSSLDENDPRTHVHVHPLESSPVPKRCGNIMLKSYKQSSAELKSLKQSNSEQSQLEQSNVPQSPLQPYETQKDDNNESKSPNEMGVILPQLTMKNQLHVQQGPDLQSQQERPSFQTLHIQECMSGSQSTTRHWKPQGSECDVQMPSTSDGQQNLTHGTYGQPTLSAGASGQPIRHPVQPPWDFRSWELPYMPEGLHGPYAQYWQPVPSFIPEYGNQVLAMQQGDCQRINAGGIFNRPPYLASQEPPSGETYKTTEIHTWHLYQEQKQQQQHQQKQPRSHVPEGASSGTVNNADPNRKQEEQQKEENKEIEETEDEQGKTTLKSRKTPKTSEVPKISTDGKQYDDVTAKRDQEKKDITSPQIPGLDIVGSSPQLAMRKEEQKEGKGAEAAHSGSDEIASKPGYTMVIGLSERTSNDNLLNFMEEKSGAGVKEIVFGPGRENAVVIFERKPDSENLQNKVSKKTLDGKFLEVFDMPPPTSIIVSTKDPKEFSRDALTFHFESKRYGHAELVEDGMKITEDGCYIMTFTDSDAVERVCAIHHKIEKIPLNVSPYYQFKKWTAWNKAIHGINIPEPFAHKVDPVLVRYLQSFPRAMKAVQMTMMEMHAGIELQENGVLVTLCLNPEVKACRKLVTSWRKDAEENLKTIFFSTFQVEKISNVSDIWDDFMDSVKSMTEGKDILLVEERFEDYIQLVGFYEEVKTTLGEILGIKEKLEHIRKIGKETMSLMSAAKKRLLYRDGIFQRFRTMFSDFDVIFEQSSEEIGLIGVPEDRNIAKLQINEELRKFDEPVVIQDSSEQFSQFIKEGAPRNYIIKEMETNGLMVDWDVSTENGHVSVYCIPADHTQYAATEMKKMVKETNIPLSESAQLFVTTEEWMMYQAEVGSKCDGLVHIVVTNDLKNVIWISMEGLYGEILEELKDFIKKNTVVEEMIQCNPITKKFMQAFWDPEDYKEIEENSRDMHLHLTWQGDRLMVKGTAEGIQTAKDLFKVKTSRIINKSHTLKRVGIKEVLLSEEHTGLLRALEKEHRCLIQTENSDVPRDKGLSRDAKMEERERVYDTVNESVSLESPKSGPYRCQNGLTISLTKGQLAQQKVDVIVCSTSPDLNLNSGAACKSLLQWGGRGLQDECRTKYTEKIQEGQIVDIKGGDLQCARVYLTVLPDWKKSNKGQSLRDVVIQCLVKAHDDSKRSIAFAAMGTGQLHYPHLHVARLMYDACILYDSNNPQSSVKKVHFVLYEKDYDSLRAFEKEEKDMLCGGARPRSSPPAPQECLVGNVKISQTVEKLASQQVDAILCSCAENLVLSQSGACADLLRVGGQTLQDECRIKYPNGIKQGQIAIIGGGNLKCKHVFLTALPQYGENGDKALFDVITAALKLAAKRGCKSIAMPAMGSGYLKYPAALVAMVMYDAVGDWAKKNTSSSLTTVKFVLFYKDKSTQDAFQDQLRGTLPRNNIRKQRSINVHDVKTLPCIGSCIVIDPSNDSVCTVGKMKVKVYTGDILNETTDAIVNSVGADFLLQGGVSALLKQKCPGLEKKCQDKVEELYESGVVMTDSFGLKCKKIIHVKFQDTLTGWKRVMKKCLEKASKNKLSSIAFPLLGTGGGYISFAADKIAEMFFEALINFDDGEENHRLRHVNVVVYHKQPQFIPAIKKGMVQVSLKGPRGKFGRIWDKIRDFGRDVKDVFLPKSGCEYRQASTLSRSQMSQVTIQVYSDSELNITRCITNLEMKLNTVYTSTPLHDDLITKMSPQEVEEFFKTDLLVECEFQQEEKQVLIRGTQQNVSRAQHEFHGKLRDRARKENEKEEAEQLRQIIQWHYEEVTSEETKLTPYDKLINLKMEKAFKNGDRFLELPDPSNDTVYIIDFKNYIEYIKGDEDDSVKIVRKDILKAKVGSLPETWDEMQDKENLKRVNVLNLSPEYQQLESIFLKEAKTGPYSDRVPNAQNIKVVKIERIQNKTLHEQYSAKKKLMETRYKDKPAVTIEQKVWHGTPYDSVDGICTHGFNRSYCGKNGVWFGHGVYFATNASYSASGWLAAGNQTPAPGTKQYIFYVSVCVGEYVQGNKDMRVLPAKNQSNPTDVYDSAVNNVNNVEEIVIFNDTQAYPNYLITFTS